MIKNFLLVAILASFLGSMAACNTMKGVGKDTEHAGENIQDAADRSR